MVLPFITKNKIGSIAGDFIDNYIFSSSDRPDAQGGAIYNAGTIDNITGNFISNHLTIDSPANYLFLFKEVQSSMQEVQSVILAVTLSVIIYLIPLILRLIMYTI